MEVWSIDPGERIGFACWGEDGSFRYKRVITESELFEMLADEVIWKHEVATYVVEQWAFDPGRTGRGDKMKSSQVIGAIRFAAYAAPLSPGAEVVFQDPGILRIAALHSGTSVPKVGHIKDDVSAYLHGFYYFETKGVLKARAIW